MSTPPTRPAPVAGRKNNAQSVHEQETAHLEAQAYELEQKTALAHEAKTVLDSWVRYEGQVKNRRQKDLAESVIAKVIKELENPRNMQTILTQSIADVESMFRPRSQSCGAHANITTEIVASKAQ